MASKKLTVEAARAYLEEYHFTPSARSESAAPPGLVGVELEAYPYKKLPTGIHPLDDPHPLFEILVNDFSLRDELEKADPISKKIFLKSHDSIQFEPGGQTELITSPVNTLPELWERTKFLKQRIREAGKGIDVCFGQVALQPWFKPADLALKVKTDRYQNMKNYFDALSPYGRRMMLESCSLQVNLDLGSTPGQAAKRIILANLLVPFATALFANSPRVAGPAGAYQSYRYQIWRKLDPLRSGTSYAQKFTAATTLPEILEAYLQFALNAPALGAIDGAKPFKPPVPFGAWMQFGIDNQFPDQEALRNHLTYLFPDVRIRNFLELRSIDVPPAGWEFAPICFYCGILYDAQATDRALETLLPQKDRMDHFLEQSVFGLQSDPLFEIGKTLYRIALEGYGRLPGQFRLKDGPADRMAAYYDHFILRRKTFSNMQADMFGEKEIIDNF